jgi:tetratricopeptide (TPR) repeat protein
MGSLDKKSPAVINHPLQRRALTSNTLLLCLLFSALPATLSLPIDPAAAQTSPGLPAETDRLLQQGKEQLEASQLEAAGKTLQQALQRYRQRNNRAGEAAALLYLGLLSEARGNPGQAMEALRRSLALARKLGNRALEGSALGGLGKAYLALGDSATALPFFEQSLQIARETGDRRGEATALRNQGKVYEALAQYDRAVDSLERSLSIVREIGDRRGEVEALIDLGVAYRSRSDVAKAMGFHRLRLAIDAWKDQPSATWG